MSVALAVLKAVLEYKMDGCHLSVKYWLDRKID